MTSQHDPGGALDAATPYAKAIALLRHHAERIAREDWEHQGCPNPVRRGRMQRGAGRFRPSGTLEALIALARDPDLTPERVLRLIWTPEANAWDAKDRRPATTEASGGN